MAERLAVIEPARGYFLSQRRGPLVAITPGSPDRLAADASTFLPPGSVEVFPAWEMLPFEHVSPAPDVVGRRLRTLWRMKTGTARLIVTSVRGAIQKVGDVADPIELRKGAEVEDLVERLVEWGYERTYQVETHGEVAVRGGIVDIWPAGGAPLRIERFGDEIEQVRRFSVADQRSTREVRSALVFPCREVRRGEFNTGIEARLPWIDPEPPAFIDLVESEIVLCDPKAAFDRSELLKAEEEKLAEALADTWEWETGGGRRLYSGELRADLELLPAPEGPETEVVKVRSFGKGDIPGEARRLASENWRVIITARSPDRIVEALAGDGVAATAGLGKGRGVWVVASEHERGFLLPDEKVAVLSTGQRTRRRATRRHGDFWADLTPGDHVVHYQHGIGRFAGMVTRTMGGVERDYLMVEYAGEDKLYVPTDQLDSIRRYSGGEKPRLSRLGGTDWEKTTRRARREAALVAERLVELYRDRITVEGHAFGADTPWQREMEAAFEHSLTPDQSRALREIKADMESVQPMDRLLCGDVGYGKTEVALRAAFKVVQDGLQVAVLVPTTLLAQQHYATFSDRFAPYPVNVAMLSRFLTDREARGVVEGVKAGTVDVVIGTHRLLQADMSIPKLGLLVIDEEQRFGVSHKEALKELRRNVDVLTLSATPIPRTLEMTLSGIRDMSTIATPPESRHPVITYVGEYDEDAVSASIRRELLRDGQVFYVHNRVRSIEKALAHVRDLVPTARVAAAHGQMSENQLESTMLSFYSGEIDVLVTTTIVESGLDIHSVNTLIVERADMLGLAQLYQLRGRVGRGRDRAYAYLFYPERRQLSEEAYERLKTIGEHTDLGSGFAIARRDLEIRGAGNILGEAQSGHIAAVGIDLYMQLVSEAVNERRGRPTPVRTPVRIELPVNAHIPDDYIGQESLRLEAYRRLAAADSADEIADVRAEWEDRFGPVPREAELLFDVARARAECARLGISEAVYVRGHIRLSPVELKASQQVRLERVAPKAVYKAEIGQVLIPSKGDAKTLLDLLNRLFEARDKVKSP